MSDGKLQYEIEVAGTDAAAAGLQKVSRGLDDVAAAERRAAAQTGTHSKEYRRAYSLDTQNEDRNTEYRGTVISELAAKIKRLAHVTRETNPELKWMGEGFKAAGKEAIGTAGALGGLRHGTVAASSASLAFSRLMRGDFVGAARAATMAVNSLWSAVLSNPYAAMAVVAITALAGLVTWHKKSADAAREQARAQRELNDEILGAVGHGTADVLSAKAAGMSDADLRKARDARLDEIEENEVRARETGQRAIQGPGWHLIDGKRKYKSRGTLDSEAKESMREYQESASALRSYNEELERRTAAEKRANEVGGGSIQSPEFRTNSGRTARDSGKYNEREWLSGDIKDPLARKLYLLQGAKDDLSSFDRENEGRIPWKDQAEEKQNRRRELLLKVVELEREVTREREAQAEIDEVSRKTLKDRQEEYRLSKMTTAEQLKAVEAKMAALRKGPKNTETEGRMLDLQIRRDSLAERLARETQNRDPDGSSSDDDDDDPGRRVVEGADYSMKEFNPRKRRFRGMGRQGFMGKGQGHSSAWFAAQTAGRFAASGHVGVTTEMGRPPMDVKGMELNNRLLAEIKERL